MDCGGLVVYLQDEAILTLALDLLVHDLDVLKAAALRNFAVDDWDGEFVFERLQVKLFRFQSRQFTQGPVLFLIDFHITQTVKNLNIVSEIFLQQRQVQDFSVELLVCITVTVR